LLVVVKGITSYLVEIVLLSLTFPLITVFVFSGIEEANCGEESFLC
jgi:hypothetical protein